VASLLEPSEKTWISPRGSVGKKAKKSLAASSLVRPSGPEILLLASERDSRVVHGGSYSGLTDSAFGRESKCRAKRVVPRPDRVTRLARVERGCLGSKRAMRAVNVRAIKSSSISGGRSRVSLYRAEVYVVL
jgi:hypothetical protein